MGVIVAATHLQLERPVALKFLRGEVAANSEALARFAREARAAAQLKSEHVAHVLDVSLTDDGTPYIVMEYLEGLNLYNVLEAQGVLDIPSAAEFAIQTCDGLAEAHARGIVHRDIKPDNLFLVERSPGWPSVKILDFGISKVLLADPRNISTGIIMGSPCYMSPEQLQSTSDVDHRTDIWSLGATLHELLTGQEAFDPSLTLPELVAAILHKPARPLRELRPEVPEALAAVVDRCLEKDRELRFESAAAVAQALLPFAPARARAAAERAASMTSAFPISRRSSGVVEKLAQGESATTQTDLRRTGRAPDFARADDSSRPGAPETSVAVSLSTRPPTLRQASDPRSNQTPKRLAIAVWATALLLIFVLVSLLRGSRPSVQVAAIASPLPTPAPTNAPTNALETIDLVVRVSPPSAQITVDEVPISGNPLHARYPKDGVTHSIRATAPGFDAKGEGVSFAEDAVVDMTLTRSAPPPPSRVTANSQARVAAPVSSVRPAPKRVSVPSAPSAAAVAEAPPSVSAVNPAGGRAPLRPIETKNPFGAP